MKKSIHVKYRRKIKIGLSFIFVFMLIAVYLWDFSVSIKRVEKTQGAQTLSDLAVQGATIAENKINKSLALLWAESRFMELEMDLHSDTIMHALQDTVSDENTDIIRIGIADKNGIAKATDGIARDVSNRKFFKEAMKGKEYISGAVKQGMLTQSIAVSVPVFDSHREVKGVLYGIISTTDLELYEDTQWDTEGTAQYVHIVDDQGNYIVRSRNKNRLLYGNNLYEEIEMVETSVPVEEIKESIQKKEAILTQVEKNGDLRYVYFAPMNVNNWCVVTVLTEKEISQQVNYSQEIMIHLVLKVLITLAVVGILCFNVIIKEKQKIEGLNRELSIKDKTFKMAISEIGNFVFNFNVDTKLLEFMNYDEEKLWLPRVIENFPERLREYFEEGSDNYNKIKKMMDEIDQGAEETVGELELGDCNKPSWYRVELKNIVDDDNESARIIGILEDITEEKENEIKLMKGEQIRSAVLSDALEFFEVNLNKDCLMRDGAVIQSSHSFSEILERYAELKVKEIHHEKVIETFSIRNLMRLYKSGVHDTYLEYMCKADNGEDFWVRCDVHLEKDVVTQDIIAVTIIWDINAEKVNEMKIKEQAVLDSLTKVYNRSASVEKISEILRAGQGRHHAFIIVDLDNFKMINDTLGHLSGDAVLIKVANILKKHAHPDDVVCRLGGDEFVVFMVDMPKEMISKNVKKLLEKMKFECEKDGILQTVSASIGIAVTPDDGNDFKTLYEKADIALYEVKKESKNNFKFFEEV